MYVGPTQLTIGKKDSEDGGSPLKETLICGCAHNDRKPKVIRSYCKGHKVTGTYIPDCWQTLLACNWSPLCHTCGIAHTPKH